MTQHVRKAWAGLLLFLLPIVPGGTAHASGMSIRQFGAEQLRLGTIAYRLGAANAHACANPEMLSGLVLHDLTQYETSIRPAVRSAFSLGDGVGVLEVIPGSVAEKAGLAVDDEILAINGQSLEDPQAVAHAPRSYARMNRMSAAIGQALGEGSADLLIRRRGELLHASLHGQPGCGGDAFVVNSADLNAWSDGSRLFVSSAIMRVAQNDDQLAFVVAHEMAHNILKHSSQNDTHGLLGLFGFGAAKIRREEVAADLSAVPLMTAGGFEASAAVRLLENLRSILWWNMSLDHPGFGERIRIVNAAIAGDLHS